MSFSLKIDFAKFLIFFFVILSILVPAEYSYSISNEIKRSIKFNIGKGKPGVTYKYDLTNKVKNLKTGLSQEIAEKAQIEKPLTQKEEEEKKSDPLEQVDIDPATKTLLSVLPSMKKPSVVISKEDPSRLTRVIIVEKNDSFIGIFNKLGYSRETIDKLIFLLENDADFDVRRLKLGQRFIISEKIVDNKPEFHTMQVPVDLEIIKIVKDDDEEFKLFVDEKEVKSEFVYKEGKIQSSIVNLASRLKIPSKVVAYANKILSNRYNLRTQLRKNDKFKILYQKIYDQNGKLINSGRVLYVAIEGKVIDDAAYRFTNTGNQEDAEYYDKSGTTFIKSITRNPLKKKFRISSHFGYRNHPVLKRRLLHSGTDYAAPIGTPIYAAGDGTITKIGRNGGYGKYIKIKHDSTWETSYAHMNGFAKGMRKWKRVKKGQKIGYVGNTGRSTGPHLHYEIIKYGKPVNAMKVKLPTGKKLSGSELSNFKKELIRIDDIVKVKK